MSALTAAFSAGLKVAESNRQESLSQFSVFAGGDQDLILMPVNPAYALLLAGKNLADAEALPRTLQAMTAVKEQAAKSLQQMADNTPAGSRNGGCREADAGDRRAVRLCTGIRHEPGRNGCLLGRRRAAARQQTPSDDMIP
jgi:hypothetical protein